MKKKQQVMAKISEIKLESKLPDHSWKKNKLFYSYMMVYYPIKKQTLFKAFILVNEVKSLPRKKVLSTQSIFFRQRKFCTTIKRLG